VVQLEEIGLDVVWVAEAYGYDAATRLGYLAARTRRVELASGIFPIYSRTPALLAQTAAGLDEISGGRAILGLGASGPQVIEGWHGVPYDRPVQRTREIVEICRMVWRRQEVRYDGRAVKLPLPAGEGTGLGKALKILTHPVRDRIPVYIASMGERSVELTAELAEGWLPIFFVPEKADSIWGKALQRGFAKRSPDLGTLDIAAGGALAIGDGLEGLRELARPHLALYIGGMGAREKNFYNDLARMYGYEREAAEIQDLYLSGQKQAAEAIVPGSLLESLSLIGPEGYVKDRIAAFKAAGVTLLDVQPVGPDPLGDFAKVKHWIS
jgi:F420-dependent oxidoreductase-like protein